MFLTLVLLTAELESLDAVKRRYGVWLALISNAQDTAVHIHRRRRIESRSFVLPSEKTYYGSALTRLDLVVLPQYMSSIEESGRVC